MNPYMKQAVQTNRRITQLQQEQWSEIAGVVSAVNATSPPTVDVDAAGGTIPTLRYQDGATPTIGDVCWVKVKGSQAMYVIVLAT